MPLLGQTGLNLSNAANRFTQMSQNLGSGPGASIGSSGLGQLSNAISSAGSATIATKQMFGAGQGPVQGTGQASDNPFNNSFFFQIPTSPTLGAPSDNSSQNAATGGNGGYGQYLPIIVVGVIVAGLGYYLFQRKR